MCLLDPLCVPLFLGGLARICIVNVCSFLSICELSTSPSVIHNDIYGSGSFLRSTVAWAQMQRAQMTLGMTQSCKMAGQIWQRVGRITYLTSSLGNLIGMSNLICPKRSSLPTLSAMPQPQLSSPVPIMIMLACNTISRPGPK